MTDPVTELDRLAKEAAREAYNPRAKKCWRWFHQWTMWEQSGHRPWVQQRRCLRCGKRVEKWIR